MSASSRRPASNAVGRIERGSRRSPPVALMARSDTFASARRRVAAVMEQHGGRGQSTRKKLFEKESFEPVGRSRIPSWIKRRLISGRI